MQHMGVVVGPNANSIPNAVYLGVEPVTGAGVRTAGEITGHFWALLWKKCEDKCENRTEHW